MNSIQNLLADRRGSMNPSWLGSEAMAPAVPGLALDIGVRNYGDDFAFMLAALFRRMGHAVTFLGPLDGGEDQDAYVLGPGPGDPGDLRCPGTAAAGADVDVLLASGAPFLAVCLSHQVLARRLGLGTRRLPIPNQGSQREVRVFGVTRRLAFYNSFAVPAPSGLGPRGVELSLDRDNVIAMRSDRFWSLQFHPESILSVDGPPVLRAALDDLAAARAADRARHAEGAQK